MRGLILITIQFTTIFLLFLSGPLMPNNGISFVFLIIGLLLGAFALWEMRRSKIRITPEVATKAQLITSGPYSVIRHPMYTAVLLVGISMLLNDFSLLRLGIYCVLLCNQILKLQYEESLLETHFHEYSEYKKKTHSLLPFLF